MTMTRVLIILAAAVVGSASPAPAQNATLETRVGKVEKELRAVQRKVFPGGNEKFFEAEITAPTAALPGGIPASSAVNDLTGRVGALESEIQRLTAQTEENGFKLRQLEQALAKFRADTESRLNGIEGVSAAPLTPPLSTPPFSTPSTPPILDPAPPPPAPIATPSPAAPATGDPGEDAYMAGYRLWEAKRYGDAQAALKAVVAKYPKHRRASFAQNLLGRAYLDEGKPALAAEAFIKSYNDMPRGERAPDSLFFLGQSLMKLGKAEKACQAYAELIDVYGVKIDETLRAKVAKGQVDAKCAL